MRIRLIVGSLVAAVVFGGGAMAVNNNLFAAKTVKLAADWFKFVGLGRAGRRRIYAPPHQPDDNHGANAVGLSLLL